MYIKTQVLLIFLFSIIITVLPDIILFKNDDGSTSDYLLSTTIELFALKIEQVIREDFKEDQNLIYSPLSIFTILSLLLLGTNGTTNYELRNILGIRSIYGDHFHNSLANLLRLDSQPTGSSGELTTANGIFIQNKLKLNANYLNILRDNYNSDIIKVDFTNNNAREFINMWVNQRTRYKINSILDRPPRINTKVLLANAVYLKSMWKYPFDKQATQIRSFKVNNKLHINIPMMFLAKTLPYAHSQELNCQIFALPYNNTELILYVILPDIYGNVPLLMSNLRGNPHALNELIKSMKEKPLIIGVPKLNLETKLSLKNSLYKMGVKSIFNPHTADFSSMFENTDQQQEKESKGIFVENIEHRVKLDIDEHGTEASSVTSVSISRDGRAHNIRVDHPFIIILRHSLTNIPIFMGSIMKP